MVRSVRIICLLIIMGSSSSFAFPLCGVDLPDTISAEGEKLILNGAGVRKHDGVKIYVGALYLAQKKSNSSVIIDEDRPMAIRLLWLRAMPRKTIVGIWRSSLGFATGGDLSPIRSQVKKIMEITQKVSINRFGSLDLIYIPGEGTKLFENSGKDTTYLGNIEGIEFKKTLFKIWLGDNPELVELRQSMLGEHSTNPHNVLLKNRYQSGKMPGIENLSGNIQKLFSLNDRCNATAVFDLIQLDKNRYQLITNETEPEKQYTLSKTMNDYWVIQTPSIIWYVVNLD